MVIRVYFDASHNSITKVSGLSFVIKDGFNNILKQSSEKTACMSSTEAELKSLNRALKALVLMKENNLIANKTIINIFGDNKPLMDSLNLKKHIKGIEKNYMIDVYGLIENLKEYYKLSLLWVNRTRNKEADKETRIVLLDKRGIKL